MSAAIPEPLDKRPFTAAIASVWGLSRHRIARLNLSSPTRGVSLPPEAHSAESTESGPDFTPEAVSRECAALDLVLECHAFSHVTAARLHGLPVPRSLDAAREIHIMRDARDGAVRRRGLVGHRGLFVRETVMVAGVEATSLVDTWVDMES